MAYLSSSSSSSLLSLCAGGNPFGDEVRTVQPGAYRCVCVELVLSHLGVNCVLNSSALNDIEGTDFVPDVIESGDAGAAGALAAGECWASFVCPRTRHRA
jgi:hypothetical protein